MLQRPYRNVDAFKTNVRLKKKLAGINRGDISSRAVLQVTFAEGWKNPR